MATHKFNVLNQVFEVDTKYSFIRELGLGAYGVVCACKNTETDEEVAIKRISKVFDRKIIAKRTLRELKLLHHFKGHENIIAIMDILKPPPNFEEIYVIQELMEADMHQIIRSQQPLTDDHFQYFIYQILRGLKFIHSANVLHRDLKPGNLLVNSDCELKICDFGLARGYSDKPENNIGFMTEYVATRWYRAPEIMLSFQKYTKAIDIWSVGCIFAEMLGGKVLFAGKDYVHQLNLILGILGTPSNEAIDRIGSKRAQEYIRSLQKMPKVPFSRLYPKAGSVAIDMLERMLDFDPVTRITVEEALAHPYLARWHDAEDEPVHTEFDFSFEVANAIPELRERIYEEITSYYHGSQAQMKRDAAKMDIAGAKSVPKASENEISAAEELLSSDVKPMDIDEDLEKELANGI